MLKQSLQLRSTHPRTAGAPLGGRGGGPRRMALLHTSSLHCPVAALDGALPQPPHGRSRELAWAPPPPGNCCRARAMALPAATPGRPSSQHLPAAAPPPPPRLTLRQAIVAGGVRP
jgi:hypothetical protein